MGNEVRSSGAGSFAPQTAGVVFDIAKEDDALAVLKVVHRSVIDPDTKNALRDSIFEYRQGFDQAALTHACELFASVGITVVGCADTPSGEGRAAAPAAVKQSSVSRFGGSRRSAFGRDARPVPAVKPAERLPVKLRIDDTPSTSPQSVTAAPTSAPWPIASTETTVQPAPERSAAPTPTPEPAPAAAPQPVPEAKPKLAVTETPAPPPPTPVPAPPQTSLVDRINEIKRDINDRVGNPVNLISQHQEIGREYMNALLEAMKKSNGGQADEVAIAMERLEKAYTAVDTALSSTAPAIDGTPAENPTPVAPVSALEPSPAPSTPPVPESVPAPETTPEPTPIPQPAPMATPIPTEPAVKPAPVAETPPEPPSKFDLVAPVAKGGATPIVSVAKAKQVEDLMYRQMVESSEREEIQRRAAEASMDPIMVSEVTSGLHQLLAEWSLFKSSGLFGTGPSGADHPLYKRISTLPMQSVVAGRFEGATPQIRQSISDYMNGWRYEEGIVFDYGETFEHYLRRVVHHILGRKKDK